LVGRFRSIEGIKLPNRETTKPGKINFNDFIKTKGKENVYVLAHRPGIGKTYSILKFLKKKIETDKDFRFFYFTDRHNSIREHTKDWKEGTYSHWMGFDKICIDPRKKNLYKYHIWPENICSKCGKCNGYQQQFDNNTRVFAPFNYLSSKHFKKNPPDIVIIDENPKQFTSYTSDIENAIKLFELMEYKSIIKLINGKEWKVIEEKYPYEKVYFRYQDYILKLAENKTENEGTLKFIAKFNIYNFYQYIHWENIYKYDLKSYGVPTLYYGAFETITNGIPVVFMDATFNKHFFSYLLESYNGERKFVGEKGFTNLNITVYRQRIEDIKRESIIYRMKPEDSIPKTSFMDSQNWERTRDTWLSTHLKFIMKLFKEDNVGIITYKDLGGFSKAVGYDVELYGNLRGTNLLENKPVLVLLGSYLPIVTSWFAKKKRAYDPNKKYFDDLLSEYFLLDVNKENLISVGLEAPEFLSKKYDFSLAKVYLHKYVGKKGDTIRSSGDIVNSRPAETLSTIMWYDEIYQAFHRNRPLRNKRIIFSYCWFPEPKARILEVDKNNRITDKQIGRLLSIGYNIRDEFKEIEKVQNDNDKLIELFEYLSETEYGKGGLIEDIVSDILSNPNITSKELTQKYRIQKTGDKRGADTIPITQLINTINELKEKANRIKDE
jgi:transposase-like protein